MGCMPSSFAAMVESHVYLQHAAQKYDDGVAMPEFQGDSRSSAHTEPVSQLKCKGKTH